MSESNKKVVFASIMATILVTGLLALNPSTTTNTQAQMYSDQYHTTYDDKRYGYDKRYLEQDKKNHKYFILTK